jgi:transglutaminase-like putative cysteine protease
MRFLLAAFFLPLSALAAPTDTRTPPHVRTFQFTYAATVTGLKPGQPARIWVPVASSNDDQEVEILTKDLPAEGRIRTEPRYGNRILYLEAKAAEKGEIPLSLVYRVKRREVKGQSSRYVKEDAGQLARLLQPDARVPIAGKPLDLLKGKTLPGDEMEAARVCYDVVNAHMRYSKEGAGWGQGDSLWACEKGYGNCSDFHSLFISLARSQHIPAKFEIGFSLPAKRGAGDISGYHCWAKFHPKGKGWVPVDISEANKNPARRDYYFGNLTEDRVALSTGRDLDLAPRQSGPPLNFFIDPYVEVDGKKYPQAKIHRRVNFRDERGGQQGESRKP